jgi:hypothetical protein
MSNVVNATPILKQTPPSFYGENSIIAVPILDLNPAI